MNSTCWMKMLAFHRCLPARERKFFRLYIHQWTERVCLMEVKSFSYDSSCTVKTLRACDINFVAFCHRCAAIKLNLSESFQNEIKSFWHENESLKHDFSGGFSLQLVRLINWILNFMVRDGKRVAGCSADNYGFTLKDANELWKIF